MANVGKEQSRRLNIVVSSGSGSGTIASQWDVCRWIRVIPVAESDTYTVIVKDADGDRIIERTGQTGTLSENLEISLGIAKTVEISSAAQDGTYKVKLDLH